MTYIPIYRENTYMYLYTYTYTYMYVYRKLIYRYIGKTLYGTVYTVRAVAGGEGGKGGGEGGVLIYIHS